MASTRIRYTKDGNLLSSRRVFSVNLNDSEISAKVILNTDSMTFTIVDSATDEVLLTGGRTKNLAVLKIQAKEGLKELGYEFSSEVRNRGEDNSMGVDVTSTLDLSAASVNG